MCFLSFNARPFPHLQRPDRIAWRTALPHWPTPAQSFFLSFNSNISCFIDGRTHRDRALQQPLSPRTPFPSVFRRRHWCPCPRLALPLAPPVYQWKSVSRPVPRRNVRFVPSRDAHPDVDLSTDGGQGRAEGHGTIARARRRHPDVSGSTKYLRHDGALGMEHVVEPSQRCRLPWISSL